MEIVSFVIKSERLHKIVQVARSYQSSGSHIFRKFCRATCTASRDFQFPLFEYVLSWSLTFRLGRSNEENYIVYVSGPKGSKKIYDERVATRAYRLQNRPSDDVKGRIHLHLRKSASYPGEESPRLSGTTPSVMRGRQSSGCVCSLYYVYTSLLSSWTLLCPRLVVYTVPMYLLFCR